MVVDVVKPCSKNVAAVLPVNATAAVACMYMAWLLKPDQEQLGTVFRIQVQIQGKLAAETDGVRAQFRMSIDISSMLLQ